MGRIFAHMTMSLDGFIAGQRVTHLRYPVLRAGR
jgi:hypothetical protein